MSASSISQHVPQFKTCCAPPCDAALIDALDQARLAYWQAWDRHDYCQADAHAAHYRAILRRAYLGEDIDNRLSHLERVLLEQERRIDALERGEVLGEGAL